MFTTMISRRLAEYITLWIILAETVIMLFVSIVMVQAMSPESAPRICDVAFAGKKTIWRLIVHILGVYARLILEYTLILSYRSQMRFLSLPRSPLSRSLWQNLKLSSESESSDTADSQSLPRNVDDDMESAEQEGMKRSADVEDISEDEDSCSTTSESQDPDLQAPRRRSRVDELSPELVSADQAYSPEDQGSGTMDVVSNTPT